MTFLFEIYCLKIKQNCFFKKKYRFFKVRKYRKYSVSHILFFKNILIFKNKIKNVRLQNF